MDVVHVAAPVDGAQSDLVGGAYVLAALDAAAGHPHGEAPRIVVAPKLAAHTTIAQTRSGSASGFFDGEGLLVTEDMPVEVSRGAEAAYVQGEIGYAENGRPLAD